MKKADLIVMLTNNDLTVPNALELFEECRGLSVQHWGCKDVGLPDDKLIELGRAMHKAGKTTYYEIVTLTDEAHEKAAKIAVEAEFSNVTCGMFYQPLADAMKRHGMGYMPNNGRLVHEPEPDGPVNMVSDRDELKANTEFAMSHGADGIDFVPFRSTLEDGEALAIWLRHEFPDIYLCAAGSVSSKERIRFVCEHDYDAFTTGGALFKGVYVPGGGFYDNLKALSEFMATL